jgi:hypothetical protein
MRFNYDSIFQNLALQLVHTRSRIAKQHKIPIGKKKMAKNIAQHP